MKIFNGLSTFVETKDLLNLINEDNKIKHLKDQEN